MRKLLVIICFLVAYCSIAQDRGFRLIPQEPIRNLGKDLGGYFSEPFKNPKRSLMTLGAFSALTVGAYLIDDEIQSWTQANRFQLGDDLTYHVFERFGNGTYSIALIGGIGLSGLVFKNEKWLETAYIAGESFILAGLISRMPKIMIGRRRPYVGDEAIKNDFFGLLVRSKQYQNQSWELGKNNAYAAYISGHTTVAFSLATVIAEQYRKYNDGWLVPVSMYTLASLAGLSRVYENKHWMTDVIGGAFLGCFTGRFLVNNHHWDLQPIVGEQTGVVIRKVF